jgi:hypothetical protein
MKLKLLTAGNEELVDPGLCEIRDALLRLVGQEGQEAILEDPDGKKRLQLSLVGAGEELTCLIEYHEYLPGAGGQEVDDKSYSCEGVPFSTAVELFHLYLEGDENWRNKIEWELNPAFVLFHRLREEVWEKGLRGEGIDFLSLEGKLPGEKIQKLMRRHSLALKVQGSSMRSAF